MDDFGQRLYFYRPRRSSILSWSWLVGLAPAESGSVNGIQGTEYAGLFS